MQAAESNKRDRANPRWRVGLVWESLRGVFYCMRAVLPQMRQRRDGLIININSISGKRSNPLGGLAYNAAWRWAWRPNKERLAKA